VGLEPTIKLYVRERLTILANVRKVIIADLHRYDYLVNLSYQLTV
jgi:hypothetical protein